MLVQSLITWKVREKLERFCLTFAVGDSAKDDSSKAGSADKWDSNDASGSPGSTDKSDSNSASGTAGSADKWDSNDASGSDGKSD